MSSTATRKKTAKKAAAKAAKKTGGVAAAGRGGGGVGGHTHAMIAAALKRAVAQIESLDGAKDPLPEGGYPMDLSVTIRGDITVGAAKDDTTINDFTDKDLLLAVMSLMKPEQVHDWIDEAVAQLKKAAKDQTLATMLKSTGMAVCDAADRAAKKRRLRKTRAGARGSVSGKPTLIVSGVADIGAIEITVAGDSLDKTEARDAA